MSNVELTSKNEVANFQEADQFQPAETQFACGYFAAAMARTMSRPGEPPTMSAAQVIANGEKWYAQYNGSDAASNTNGMTSEQEYELLGQIGLHYQAIDPDISQVRSWLEWGYPCMIAVTESSVRDLALDGANPYPWPPSGTHIILATGIGAGGHLLCRDSANVTSLYNPGTLRPGPRLYDEKKLQLVSATIVVPPWRPRPTSATAIPTADMQIPDGWSDDMPTATLTASNGIAVAEPFRSFILAHRWQPGDTPMTPAQQSVNPVELGRSQRDGNNAGARLICMYSELCWTESRGVYIASVGREFWTALQNRSQPAPATDNSAIRQDIMAGAKLIGDTANHLLAQAQTIA